MPNLSEPLSIFANNQFHVKSECQKVFQISTLLSEFYYFSYFSKSFQSISCHEVHYQAGLSNCQISVKGQLFDSHQFYRNVKNFVDSKQNITGRRSSKTWRVAYQNWQTQFDFFWQISGFANIRKYFNCIQVFFGTQSAQSHFGRNSQKFWENDKSLEVWRAFYYWTTRRRGHSTQH